MHFDCAGSQNLVGWARVLFKTGTSLHLHGYGQVLGKPATAPDAKVSKAGSGEVVEDFRKAEGPKHWASDLRSSMTPALFASRELRNLCCQQAHWRTREHHEEQRAGSGELRQRGLSSPFDISFHPAPYWVSPVADESAGEWKVAIPPFGRRSNTSNVVKAVSRLQEHQQEHTLSNTRRKTEQDKYDLEDNLRCTLGSTGCAAHEEPAALVSRDPAMASPKWRLHITKKI